MHWVRFLFAAVSIFCASSALAQTGKVTASASIVGNGTVWGFSFAQTASLDCPSKCSDSFTSGTYLNLSATPVNAGWRFSHWIVAGSQIVEGSTTTSQIAVILNANTTITATFVAVPNPPTAKLSLRITGPGEVTSDIGGLACSDKSSAPCTQDYIQDQTVVLIARSSLSRLLSWSGCTNVNNGQCIVRMSQAKEVTATFASVENPKPKLSVRISGQGEVIMERNIICSDKSPMPCTQEYAQNEVVGLYARATTSRFLRWIGCPIVSGPNCTVTMDQAKEITAVFDVPNSKTVTINIIGSGTVQGLVFASPLGFTCKASCTASFPIGTDVTVAAFPLNSNWRFGSWTVDGVPRTGSPFADIAGTSSIGIRTDADMTINITFLPFGNPKLSLRITGQGEVSSATGDFTCTYLVSMPCMKEYAQGQTVTLVARATTSRFLNWTGCTSTGGNTCNVLMDQAKEVTAAFEDPTPLTLNIIGEGTITSTPTGVNCKSNCSVAFNKNQVVTLTAIPAEGWRFSYWANACTGTGTCSVTMNTNKTVQAVFTKPTTVGNFTEFSVASANSNLRQMTAGPDGNIWVTQSNARKIAKITLDGTVKEYAIPTNANPYDIVAGPDQALWFTLATIKLGRITTDGVATEHPILAVADASAIDRYGIATGPDGNIWIAEYNANAISKVTASGEVKRFFTAGGPRHIATGPDGNLWFTQTGSNKIARITPSGEITEFSVPTANAGLGDITRGPDGAMWFIEEQARKIGRVSMTGAITEFEVTSTTALSGANIVTGPDQNLWFTYGTSARLGQMTIYGVLTEYNTLSTNGTTQGIATGSDGNIWYTDSTANKIGRLTLRAVRQGAVFSTAQDSARSFLRFANTGTTNGRVSVSLLDPDTGLSLNHWTSPNIAPNASAQVYIDTIERAGNATFTKPEYYSVAVRPHLDGYMQHVLWKPSDGTLTNLSTCDTGVTAPDKQLFNVHSTMLDEGYPATIAVSNTGMSSATVQLGIYNADTGTKLGTYTTSAIAAGAQLNVSVAALEQGAKISTENAIYHYDIKVEGTFTGYLQHLVNNKSTGVVTDMTTACSLTPTPATARSAQLTQGSVFASAQPGSRSYVRFYNNGAEAGSARVTLADAATGTIFRQWTSPTIPVGAAHQIYIQDIEGAGLSNGDQYLMTATAQFDGAFQHILWRPSNGTLTNLTTCNASVAADARQLMNVHSSLLSSIYPSSIVVNNTGSANSRAFIGIYDATTGAKLGTYLTNIISAEGHALLQIAQVEAGANVQPGTTIYHYVLKLEGSFTGYLQHLVNNKSTGVITDMTTTCLMKAS